MVDEQMFVFTLEAPAGRRREVLQLNQRPCGENSTPRALNRRRAPTAPNASSAKGQSATLKPLNHKGVRAGT